MAKVLDYVPRFKKETHRRRWAARNRVTYIYAVSAGDLVKIGKSDDPCGRLRTLQSQSPTALECVLLTEGVPFLEHALHARLRHLRRHGEWFEDVPEVRRVLQLLGNDKSLQREVNKSLQTTYSNRPAAASFLEASDTDIVRIATCEVAA